MQNVKELVVMIEKTGFNRVLLIFIYGLVAISFFGFLFSAFGVLYPKETLKTSSNWEWYKKTYTNNDGYIKMLDQDDQYMKIIKKGPLRDRSKMSDDDITREREEGFNTILRIEREYRTYGFLAYIVIFIFGLLGIKKIKDINKG